MAIFTAIGTALAGALFAGSAIAAKLIAGALAFGAQLLISYFMRPKARTYAAVQGERQYGGRMPATALFGTCATEGHHIFYAKWGSGDRFNADVFLLSNGWCDGLEPEIYFYGEKHTLVARTIIGNEVAHWGVDGFGTKISIRFFDGRPGQGPDTKLVSDTASLEQTWKSTSVCAGMAYVVVERDYDGALFEQGEPRFKFVLRGLRLYDPREDSTVAGGDGDHRLDDPATWEHSLNPAVQRLNYQLGIRGLISGRTLIGEGKSLGQLDLGSYFAAMNVADTLREGKPTYQCSLIVTGDDDHTEVLKEFDDALAGYGMNRRGLSGVIVGAPQTPVLDIGPDDIDMGRARTKQLRKSAFDLYNHMSGQFISREAQWQPESLDPIHVNADVSADGRVRQVGYDFLQVTDPDIAQYLLQIRYRQQRRGGSATLPVSRRVGFRVMEGEWVTHAGKTWLVTGWSMDESLLFTLQLAETGADVYASAGIVPGPIIVAPPPPVNPSLLSTVQDFDIEGGYITNDDGHEIPALLATWTPPDDPSITQVRIEYRRNDGEGGDSATTLLKAVSDDPEAGELYITAGVLETQPYAARATITTVPDRLKIWTAWQATSVDTGGFRWPVDIGDITDDFRDRLIWGGEGARERADELVKLALSINALASDDVLERQVIRTQVKAEVAGARASAEEFTLAYAGPGSALALRTLALEAEMEGIGGASAFQALVAQVTDIDGEVSALAESILALDAAVDGFSASGTFRVTAEATPTGATAMVALTVAASSEDDAEQAALFLVAKTGGGSETWLSAARTLILDSEGSPLAIFDEDEGGVFIDTAFIRNLTADNIDVDTLTGAEGFFDNLVVTSGHVAPLTVERVA